VSKESECRYRFPLCRFPLWPPPAGTDADAQQLYWLQSFALGGGLQRGALSLQALHQALAPPPPLPAAAAAGVSGGAAAAAAAGEACGLALVADVGGWAVAALLLQPAQGGGGGGGVPAERRGSGQSRQPHHYFHTEQQQQQTSDSDTFDFIQQSEPQRQLEVQLAAVFPGMQQAAEVFAALASAALELLAASAFHAGGGGAALRQGGLALLPAMAAAASDDDFCDSGGSGSPAGLLLEVGPEPPLLGGGGGEAGWRRCMLRFAPGCSLGALAAAVAASMVELSAAPPPPSTAPPTRQVSAAAAAATAEACGRRSSVAAVVAGARRLSVLRLEAGPACAAEEEAEAEGLLEEAMAVVEGYMEAAGYDSERQLRQASCVVWLHGFCVWPRRPIPVPLGCTRFRCIDCLLAQCRPLFGGRWASGEEAAAPPPRQAKLPLGATRRIQHVCCVSVSASRRRLSFHPLPCVRNRRTCAAMIDLRCPSIPPLPQPQASPPPPPSWMRGSTPWIC
jgi:hypothetical protein